MKTLRRNSAFDWWAIFLLSVGSIVLPSRSVADRLDPEQIFLAKNSKPVLLAKANSDSQVKIKLSPKKQRTARTTASAKKKKSAVAKKKSTSKSAKRKKSKKRRKAGAKASAKSKANTKLVAQWTAAEAHLKKAKFSKTFIAHLKANYDKKSFGSVIRLNFLTFRRSPIQKNKPSPLAIRKTGEFMKKHREILDKAKKKYGVPSDVIAALLWMESQYGAIKGHFHVTSVYVHLLQSGEPGVQKSLVNLASHRRDFADLKTGAIKKLMRERADKKRAWAIEQLQALEIIDKKDAKDLAKLRGSFAGAFGWPQFIPSSYNSYAVASSAGRKGRLPNLNRADDAILSVANYLKHHGWAPGKKAQMQSLMGYNNSEDYARTILDIASQVRLSFQASND